MIPIVFLVGAMNLGLGFALAVFLERSSHRQWHPALRQIRSKKRQKSPAPLPAAVPEPIPVAPPPPEPVVVVEEAPTRPAPSGFRDLPQDWLEALGTISVQSFYEGFLRVAEIGVRQQMDSLTHLDPKMASHVTPVEFSEFRAILGRCRESSASWQKEINACQQPATCGAKLEKCQEWLRDLDAHLAGIDEADLQARIESGHIDRKTVRKVLHDLFAVLCNVRDRCGEELAQLFQAESRVADLSSEEIVNGDGQLNRLGLAFALKEWTDKDPDRVRMASAIVVDIDQCGHLNEEHGLHLVDATLIGVRGLIKELVRKDRGFDRVAALTGQSILVLLGDTALRNATSSAERIRQSILATTFKSDTKEFGITTSCAVTEWLPSESFDEMVARLKSGISHSKKSGKNCTAVCNPDEIRLAQSSKMQVAAKTLTLAVTH